MALDPKLTKFSTTSPTIVSFDSTEFAEGTGVVSFFGIRLETSGGVTYALTTNVISSAGNEDLKKVINVNATYNFDLAPFNLPKTIKGTAYFSATGRSTAGAGPTVAVTIQHYDGSTVTDISSAVTSQNVNGGDITEYFFALPITEKHFAIGDILRVEVVLTNAGASNWVFINPLTATGVPMRVLIPFKIDI